MQYTRVKHRAAPQEGDPRVRADLDALVRLQFEAEGVSFLPRQPLHSVLYGRHASRLRGRGLDFEEIRGYLPGDDIRSIDWRVTARTGEPHVRVYTEERDRTVWLLVDQRIGMFFGSRVRTKTVVAAEAAAISAWRVLAMKDRVGAIVFDDESLEVIRPGSSRAHVMRILGAIVTRSRRMRADSPVRANPAMFDRALERVGPLARHDCLVGLISDFAGAGPDSRRMLTRINGHNDLIAIAVHDPLEAEMPEDDVRWIVSDGSDQLEVDPSNASIRKRFRDEFDDRLGRLAELSARQAIPLIPLSTDQPVAAQVRAALGRRIQARRA